MKTQLAIASVGLALLSGCISLPTKYKYATVYIKTVNDYTAVAVSAQAISACDGLSLGDTLIPKAIEASAYWFKGKRLSIIAFAEGYVPAFEVALIEKWHSTRGAANLDANEILVRMQPISNASRISKFPTPFSTEIQLAQSPNEPNLEDAEIAEVTSFRFQRTCLSNYGG